MTRRCVLSWLTAVLVFALPGTSSQAPAQTVLATANSTGRLAADLEYLVKSVAPDGDQGAQAFLQALRQFKEGELLKGHDRDRLLGIAASLPHNPGEAPMVVAAIPVTDFAAYLDSLQVLGMTVEAEKGVAAFSHRITTPDGARTFFALESKKYAFLSLMPTGAQSIKSLDPASWRPSTGAQSDLSLVLKLSELPEAMKSQFIANFEASLPSKDPQRPNESDDEYKGRMTFSRMLREAVNALIREGDRIELNLAVDRSTEQVALDLAVTALPNTPFAKTVNDFQGRKSRFSWLGTDSPLSAWASLPLPKYLSDVLQELLEKVRQEGESKTKNETEKKVNSRLFGVLKAALSAPDVDLGLALQGPFKNQGGQERFTMLGMLKVPSGQEVDRLFRDVTAQTTPADKMKVKLDVGKGQDGTAIHQMTADAASLDPNLVKHCGDAGFFLAFPENAVLISFGEVGLKSIQHAIETLAARKRGGEEPVALQTHLSTLVELSTDQDREAAHRAASEAFKGAQAGKDRVALTMNGDGRSLRLRLGLDVPALKFAVRMGPRGQAK
jgi:hypothetical protein